MRTLVMGDVHGNYKGVLQVLERANYDPTSDMILQLGDVSDGWPETKECVEFFINHNGIYLRGNHDIWVTNWLNDVVFMEFQDWLRQGGSATYDSYGTRDKVPESHKDFFKNQLWYFIDEQNRCFVHAGWDYYFFEGPEEYFQENGDPKRNIEDLVWLRRFLGRAVQLHQTKSFTKNKFTKFDEVFIGHSALVSQKPTKFCEVWNLDTGSGFDGVLTVMDVDTHEYWQSDPSPSLYPNFKGRY